MSRYAEVIGDPIVHSLSPAIHSHWLRQLGLPDRYRATQVSAAKLPSFLERRRDDPDWVGCSVTAPLKQIIVNMVEGVEGDEAVYGAGAVNCVYRDRWHRLIGTNTDVDGIAAALAGVRLRGTKAVVIGAGGAAAAMHWWLLQRSADTIVLARDPQRAAETYDFAAKSLDEASACFGGAKLIVNATPMGMIGGPVVPVSLLTSLDQAPPDAWVMDMVYRPLETPLLAAARARGLRTVDGLAMLIGQARRAFRLFFGVEPPSADGDLRILLTRAG